MPLESASGIWDLDPSWPLGTDSPSEGDDHLRLVKQVLQDTFPNVQGVVTASHTQMNVPPVSVGGVMAYTGATPPNGYVFCRGQELDRTTYSELYTVIGDTYGDGNGTTSFNVPDMQERIAAGGLRGNVRADSWGLGGDKAALNFEWMIYTGVLT